MAGIETERFCALFFRGQKPTDYGHFGTRSIGAVRCICKQEKTEEEKMRHCYIRLVIGLVWVVAALSCIVRGNLSMTVLYGALGVVFMYTAYTIWKKEKTGGR